MDGIGRSMDPSSHAAGHRANRRLLVALLTWLAFAPRVAAAQAPPEPGALADAFAHAWNTHDPRAFGRLYAEDADWVTVAGARYNGRAVIEGVLGREHESWARLTTLRATDVVIRRIGADHAVVMFRWEIARTTEPTATPVRGTTFLVAALQAGRWVILAGQASSLPAPR